MEACCERPSTAERNLHTTDLKWHPERKVQYAHPVLRRERADVKRAAPVRAKAKEGPRGPDLCPQPIAAPRRICPPAQPCLSALFVL
eukprot:CAMPEP_0198602134 /NCGR_PEP_ID=MMETSP1462-20131121/150349_1 /TAXON_ID=1333877 /ORGANISM="Brandtodinium nutriculum, Strain RCC3387" /LENGTH=86 /DNA_ID=CAMNT_0044333879 /DNA_START=44 /DNA_END=301 /DNA_ORIENTATION=-